MNDPTRPLPGISCVIPVHNEEKTLQDLHRQITGVCVQQNLDYEIIFVDDGSSDGSMEILRGIAVQDPYVKVIRLRRNFGQTAAMSAGIRASKKDVVITMDADLQNDPADIPKLLAEMEKGFDVVSGKRMNRQDQSQKKLSSMLANKLISKVTGVKLSDYGCTLKAYRRSFLQSIPLYGEMHRFIPVFAATYGAKITEIPVNHMARKHGKSHYGIGGRAIRVLLDLLTVKFLHTFIARPMHFFGGIGMLFLLAGAISGVTTVALKLLQIRDFVATPLTLISIFLLSIGIQSLLLGLLAELLIRIYFDNPNRPSYEVAETIG